MKVRTLVILIFICVSTITCATKIQEPPKSKYGYVDMYGKEAIPMQYDGAWSFSERLAAVKNEKKYGFIDKEGQVQIPFDYDYAICFKEGLAAVGKDKKIGYITKDGKTAIPFEYEGGSNFRDGLAGVVKNGKLGYIDREGNIVIDFIYDNVMRIGYASDGLIPVELNKKWGYIDVIGTVKIPFEFNQINPFHAGRAYVSLDGDHFGFIDINGDVIVPLIYQYTDNDPYKAEQIDIFLECSIFSIDYAYANIGIKTVAYGWNIPLRERDRFFGGYAMVKKDRKYGFIDTKGNVVVPLEYDDAIEFAYGTGYVAREIDGKTEWYRFSSPDFDFVLLEEGLIPFYVMQNKDTRIRNEHTGRIGFLDKELNYKEFSDYDGVRYTMYGFIVTLNKKIGMIDFDGNVFTSPIYDLWFWFSEGMAVVGCNVD
jgi:hypothetical protein